MTWQPLFTAALDPPPGGLWLAAAVVPDVVMLGCIAWLWRSLVRLRRFRLLAETASGPVAETPEARERLAASEEQFRLLAENSTEVVVRLDGNDRILWISPSVATVLGWTQAESIGRDVKAINDAHGHAAGDAVLEVLSRRIRGCLRSAADVGGRIGGDELVVLLHGIGTLAEAAAFAEALGRRAAEPIPVDGEEIRATVSIGVTLFRPGEGVDDILARADDAMYRAKEGGKNRVVAAPFPAANLAAGHPGLAAAE